MTLIQTGADEHYRTVQIRQGNETAKVIRKLAMINNIDELNLSGLIISITTDGATGLTTTDVKKGTGRTGFWHWIRKSLLNMWF